MTLAGLGLRGLQWVLAVVLGAQGLAFALHPGAGLDALVPAPIRLALGSVEAAGAVLFAVPRTVALGGAALSASLAIASAVHLALGTRPPLAYLVYLATILAVWDARRAGNRGEIRRG